MPDAAIFRFPLFHYSLFYRRFLDEHYGNLIADGINETAFGVEAFQTRLGVVYLQFGLALRTAQDL